MLTGLGHRSTLAAVAAAVAYVALGAVGVFVTASSVGALVLLPGAGAMVALLMLADRRYWPLVLTFSALAGFALRASSSASASSALFTALASSLAALCVAAVARRLDPGAAREHDARGVGALLTGLAVTTVLALAAGLAGGVWPAAVVLHVVVAWSLGALIVTPAFLALARAEGAAPAGRLETAAALALVVAVCFPVFLRTTADGGFADTIGYTFLLFPPLLWLALRARTVASSAALLLVAVVGVIGTLAGRGSFARASLAPDERVVALQLFLAVATICALLVGVVGRKRLADARRLGESEELYRLMAGALPGLGIALFDHDLRVRVAHADQLQHAGVQTSTVGRRVSDLYAGERLHQVERSLRRALAGETVVFVWESRDAGGKPHVLEVRAAPHRDARGTIAGALVVAVDVTARAATEDRLRFLAERDPLTGLLNRRAFEQALEANAGGDNLLVLIDVDDFKEVNDTAGHATGDAVLVAIAETLSGRLRRGDPVARLGGDEFAVLLERVALEDGHDVATALVESVRLRTASDAELPDVTVSAGVCSLADRDAAAAFREADAAMYAAKDAGRDRCVVVGR